MAWYNPLSWFRSKENVERIDETTKAFQNVGISTPEEKNTEGEGVEFPADGHYAQSVSSFSHFYNKHINKKITGRQNRIKEYRRIAQNPEVAEIIDDATIEATRKDYDGNVVHLDVKDENLANNKNAMKNLQDEFNHLFYNVLSLNDRIDEWFRTFFIDAEFFAENVINENKKKEGIKKFKPLPTETMDFLYDFQNGKIIAFLQYLKNKGKRPATIQEAEADDNVVVFYPSQISYVNYGVHDYQKNVLGYLDKAKQPFNQLKMLETAVVIYRIVRAPERLVFKIDVGNMPREKAMKFVNKVKQRMQRKETFDPDTGTVKNSTAVTSMLDNYFIPQSADGRGSDIDTIGGNSAGFAELDDIYYFQRKLYRALKYPISRVSMREEKQGTDVVFGGSQFSEMARDELKWSVFLENQQNKFCNMFIDLFLIHLELKGLKEKYDLDESKIEISMNPPNDYVRQIQQREITTRIENYMQLANNPEFSKYFLMKHYLGWDEDTIKENADGKKKDKDMGFEEEEGMGF